jgi:hypothetical protein
MSFCSSREPTCAEAYANYDNSDYKVVPNIEKTLGTDTLSIILTFTNP